MFRFCIICKSAYSTWFYSLKLPSHLHKQQIDIVFTILNILTNRTQHEYAYTNGLYYIYDFKSKWKCCAIHWRSRLSMIATLIAVIFDRCHSWSYSRAISFKSASVEVVFAVKCSLWTTTTWTAPVPRPPTVFSHANNTMTISRSRFLPFRNGRNSPL